MDDTVHELVTGTEKRCDIVCDDTSDSSGATSLLGEELAHEIALSSKTDV
jgi:hypothetical protein